MLLFPRNPENRFVWFSNGPENPVVVERRERADELPSTGEKPVHRKLPDDFPRSAAAEPGHAEDLRTAEKKLEAGYDSPTDRAKTLIEKQKLSPENLSQKEAREKLQNLSTAQIRTLEKTNPNLLFKACFEVRGDKIIFDSGGNNALEKGVGLRVLPPEYRHLAVNGKSAVRLASGVFEYADGSGYAAVFTGRTKIEITKTPPPADIVAKLNSKTKDFYHERDLGNFLKALAGTNPDAGKLKNFGEMLGQNKIDGIPEDIRGDLQKRVEKNAKDQVELQKILGKSDKEFTEIAEKGGNPAIAAEFLKLSGLGLTPEQVAGIVGNLQQESGQNLSTTAVGDGGTSFGIAQWHNERRDTLFAFARKNNSSPDSLKTQLQFLVHELQTSESAALAAVKRAQTPEEAAQIFNRAFERSADTSNARAMNARRIYGQMEQKAA